MYITSQYLSETSLSTLIIASVIIACLSFFSKPRLLMIYILLFIYLLPRAGFFVSTPWLKFPLPIGYIFIGFIMVRWFIRLILRRDEDRTARPLRSIFFIYTIVAISAVIIGLLHDGSISTLVFEMIFYLAAFFIFYMVMDMFAGKDCVHIFMDSISICGFLVALYGILLFIFGPSMLINYVTYNARTRMALGQFINVKRVLSTYGDPNVLSAQLLVFCGIIISQTLKCKYGIMKKIFFIITIALMIICLYFTNSRASLVGIFILLLILAMTRIQKIWLYIPVLVINYIAFIEPIHRYYLHRLYKQTVAQDIRMSYFDVFLNLLTRFPFGVGFGNHLDEFDNVIPSNNVWSGFNSFYLHLFSKVGVQGVVAFLTIFFLIVKYLFKESDKIGDPNIRYFVFGATCGILVQQLNFIANNIYQLPGGMLNFWIMCGMLTTVVNLYKKPVIEQ